MKKKLSGKWSICYDDTLKHFAGELDILSSEELTEHLTVNSVLKDDERSLVLLTELDKRKCICKIPREKNRRKWIRLTTLYRQSEVKRNFLNLTKLHKLGFSTNYPLLYAEKREKGLVTDSFILYTYVEGSGIDSESYYLLMDTIRELHNKGYLHGDFHSQNFVLSDGRICFLDSAFRKNLFGKLGLCYEMQYFGKNNRTDDSLRSIHQEYVKRHYPKNCLLAAQYWLDIWRRIKKLLRSGMKRKET